MDKDEQRTIEVGPTERDRDERDPAISEQTQPEGGVVQAEPGVGIGCRFVHVVQRDMIKRIACRPGTARLSSATNRNVTHHTGDKPT